MKKTFITLFVLMISTNIFAMEEVETECQKMNESRDSGKASEAQESVRSRGQDATKQ